MHGVKSSLVNTRRAMRSMEGGSHGLHHGVGDSGATR